MSLRDEFKVHRGLWLIGLILVSLVVGGQRSQGQADPEPAAAPAGAPAAAGTAAAPPVHGASKSTLMWIIETSGWIGAFLFVISLLFVATVMRLFLELRAPLVVPRELLQECETLLSKRDYNGVYRLARESTSELGQLIATGLSGLSSGLTEARDAMDRAGEMMTVEMEKRTSMLAVVGTLGPLIGLLGTLKGMIASFSVIAMSDTQLKASEVAGGISEALILTFEGVFLSVPAIYFFALFKNRVATLSLLALNSADEFIRRVHATAQRKPESTPA